MEEVTTTVEAPAKQTTPEVTKNTQPEEVQTIEDVTQEPDKTEAETTETEPIGEEAKEPRSAEAPVAAKNWEQIAKDICLHIASSAPEFVSREQIPQEVIAEEKRIEMGKEDLAKKPENIREKIVEGRINKLMAGRCLLEQPFVKNPDQTVQQLIEGKLEVVKFDRFVLGEGLEKRQDNFAEEVMSQIKA